MIFYNNHIINKKQMKFQNILLFIVSIICLAYCTKENDIFCNDAEHMLYLEESFNSTSIKHIKPSVQLDPINIKEAVVILETLKYCKDIKYVNYVEVVDSLDQEFIYITSKQLIDEYIIHFELELVSYKDGTDLLYRNSYICNNSSKYYFELNGFMLETDNQYVYKFEGLGYIYFRIQDDINTYIKTPININGYCDIKTREVIFTHHL